MNYRKTEYQVTSRFSSTNGFEFVCVFSTKDFSFTESIISISRTFFVAIVLAVAATQFIKEANRLVLNPLERIMTKVKYIAQNPLAAADENFEF
jgi:hypothetical protein